jgi:hypothetical protein
MQKDKSGHFIWMAYIRCWNVVLQWPAEIVHLVGFYYKKKLKIGFMTEGCWYHLLITCNVASHEPVCPENLTHKDKQLSF